MPHFTCLPNWNPLLLSGIFQLQKVTTKTANHPKTPKPSKTTQNYLQPTTYYPKLAIVSTKPPEKPHKQPPNVFE